MPEAFQLPLVFDLTGVFLFALTGGWLALGRGYDLVGVFALALVSGVGGALLRDGVFLQSGTPAVLRDPTYLLVVIAATVAAILTYRAGGYFERAFLAADALGLGMYTVVGMAKSLAHDLGPVAAVLVGVSNAVGGGMIRDLLTGQEPLIFKPGQFYALAALGGAITFAVLENVFRVPTDVTAVATISAVFALRMLGVAFDWRTSSMEHWSLLARIGSKRAEEPEVSAKRDHQG